MDSSSETTIAQPEQIKARVRQLAEAPPKLHRPKDLKPGDDPAAEDGLVSTWGIQASFLELLLELVRPGSFTLETGSGLSTVCFAIIGSNHICISPFAKEHNRIIRYCNEQQISTDRIRFVAMKSSLALPPLETAGQKLDFALVDGSHTFPQPIIDYHYVNECLKVGGILALDDLNISSVGLLHEFLITEPSYEFVKFDGYKTGVYRKIAETNYPGGWQDQKLNSKYPDYSYLPVHSNIRRMIVPMEYRMREGLGKVPGLRRAYQMLKRKRAAAG